MPLKKPSRRASCTTSTTPVIVQVVSYPPDVEEAQDLAKLAKRAAKGSGDE